MGVAKDRHGGKSPAGDEDSGVAESLDTGRSRRQPSLQPKPPLEMNAPAREDRHLSVLIITESEPFHIARALEQLLRTRPSWLSIAGIVQLPFAPVGTPAIRLRRFARIYGFRDTTRAAIRATFAVIRPSCSLRAVAWRAGVAHQRTNGLKGKEAVDFIAAVDPDVVVAFGLNRIIPEALLRKSRPAWLNVHLGMLPRHRGPAPVFWALHDGDTKLGVCVHVIENEVDTGTVLARREITVTDRNLYRIVGTLRMASNEAIVEALSLLRLGCAPSEPSAPLEPIRRSPSRSDVERFRERRNRLL